MRVIKLFIISLVVLFGLVTAMSLLVPSHIRVSKAINIKADKDSIFSLINNQQNWPRWHPAFLKDSNAYEVLKKNNITVSTLTNNDSVVAMQWQQRNKRPVINTWQVHTFAASDSVALQWYMDFKLRWYPWEKFGSLFYENIYGTMMQDGLVNIKKIVQQ